MSCCMAYAVESVTCKPHHIPAQFGDPGFPELLQAFSLLQQRLLVGEPIVHLQLGVEGAGTCVRSQRPKHMLQTDHA